DRRQQVKNAKAHIEKGGDKPAHRAAGRSDQQGRPRVDAGRNGDSRRRRAKRKGAGDGQVGTIKDAKSEKDDEGHEAEDKAKLDGTPEGDGGHKFRCLQGNGQYVSLKGYRLAMPGGIRIAIL